ncbi:MAG: hypothetical protein IJ324_01510 [Lachnospiraceae bacterium]|nr:hypothetical protein [Lachnospiraceae bacterium]
MTGLFQTVLQMSITGSFVILFVILVRMILKRTPKIYSYVLWALVLFRLLCPVTIASSFSLIPEEIAEPQLRAEEEIGHTEESQIIAVVNVGAENSQMMIDSGMNLPEQKGIAPENVAAGEKDKETSEGQPEMVVSTKVSVWEISSTIWMAGVILLLGYSIFSLARIYRKVEISLHKEGNVYIAQDIDTPFTLGLFSPKIYLPTGLMDKEARYIIAHEKHHIRRLDHIIKIIAFLTLCIHWFNPLVWLAFVLAGKDMEMSCDEAVMKKFPEDIRQEYSGSLLNLATGRKIIAMAPIAFGEGNVKERIKNVMNYKKPVFWITVVAAILCIILAVCLLTNPREEAEVSAIIEKPQSTEEPENVETPLPTAEVSAAPVATATPEPKEEPSEEAWEFIEKEINVFYGDLTGDGINERIVLGIDVLEGYEAETDLLKLLNSGFLAKVSVFEGLGGGSYSEELLWSFIDISTSRPGNYQLSLIEQEEKDYLLISAIHEQQGYANYHYEVISLIETGEEILEDEYEVTFKFAETAEAAAADLLAEELPTRNDVVPDFQEHLRKWTDGEGTLIIATDLNMLDGSTKDLLYSSPGDHVSPSEYYDRVFARQDYYTLAGKTVFTTKYFTFELPEQWAAKVHYEESEDGKCVWIYHTETSELHYGMGLLGTIFLETQEFALETMNMVPAQYIGEPYTAEDGVTYMPMCCEPTDVQCTEETAREYDEMSAYFSDGRIAKYVWVTENGTANNPFWELAHYKELYPEYGLSGWRTACLGQKLPWEGYYGDYVLFDTDGEQHTLIINDVDYSDMLKDSLYLENIDNAWFAVVDFDESNDSREIIIYDDGPSGDPHLHVLQIRDGKLSIIGELGTLSFMSSFVFTGKHGVILLERTWLPENNVITKTYTIENKQFVEIPQEEYEYVNKDFHKVIQDMEVYKEQDLSSEKVILKAGEVQICFNKVFSSNEEEMRFFEIQTLEGEIYYLYSDGWLDDYVADLSHAG